MPATLPAFTDAQVKGDVKLGKSGELNTTYTVKLKKTDGTRFDGIFKPLQSEDVGCAAYEMGIDLDNPQMAIRNLATQEYANKLGFKLIVETHMAAITPPGETEPRVGLVMARAQGKPALSTDPMTLMRPDVLQETTKLQLLDHLTGQGDRHGFNSGAIHCYVVCDALALFIQLPWGGAYIDPEPARADIVRLFEWAGVLQARLQVASAQKKIPEGWRLEVSASRFGTAGWRWLVAGRDNAATPWNEAGGMTATILAMLDDVIGGKQVLGGDGSGPNQ